MDSQKMGPPPDPPDHLSEASKEIWNRLFYKIETPGRAILLQTALEAYDRALEARQVVDREGLTWESETSGAIHAHPAVKIEREYLAIVVKVFNQLRLNLYDSGMESWP